MVAEFDVESFVKEEPEIISEEIRIPVVRSGGLEGIVGVKWAATLNGNYGKRKSVICRRRNNWLLNIDVRTSVATKKSIF